SASPLAFGSRGSRHDARSFLPGARLLRRPPGYFQHQATAAFLRRGAYQGVNPLPRRVEDASTNRPDLVPALAPTNRDAMGKPSTPPAFSDRSHVSRAGRPRS